MACQRSAGDPIGHWLPMVSGGGAWHPVEVVDGERLARLGQASAMVTALICSRGSTLSSFRLVLTIP
jgi:hypothetical protein